MTNPSNASQSPHAASDEAWAEAVRREAVIRPLAATPRLNKAAVGVAARALGVSAPRVYGLLRVFRRQPVTASLLPTQPGPTKGTRRLAGAIEAKIDAAIEAVYLKPERPTLGRTLREVRQDCRDAGLRPPSIKALRARVSVRSLRERAAAREGAETAGDRFRQVQGGLRTERPLQIVQIDHTKVDIMLVDDVTRACIGRPWLTLVLDVHTRVVAGLHLSLDPPSAAGTGLAVAHAILPKPKWLADRGVTLTWPVHGIPELIHVDNGREFHSRAFTRGCEQHGIRLAYRPPATPRFGGHIERLMGTLMGRVQALPGTTFSSVAARGAYESEGRAVLTFREFERILVLEVLGPYHNGVHATLGRPPMAAWTEGSGGIDLRRLADPNGLWRDFLPFEERLVRRDGIRLFGIQYQDGALAHLVGTTAKLRVKYDPRDLSVVFVELPTGGDIRVPYADFSRPAITLWEHREAHRKLRAEGRRQIDEHAVFAAIAEQRRVLAAAYEKSKAARRAVSRADLAASGVSAAEPQLPMEDGADEPVAKVPMPGDGESSGVEFW